MQAVEYRLNFLIWTFLSLLWLGISFLTVSLIFRQTQSIAGWTKEAVLLLVLVWMIFFDVVAIFIRPSLRHFSRRLIRQGGLDFVLLRPVSSRFLTMVQDFDIDELGRLAVCGVALAFFIQRSGMAVSGLGWLNFFLVFAAATIVFHSFLFSFTVLNFWFVNLFNLDDLFDRVLSGGQFPVDIFGEKLKTVFIYLIPIGLAGYLQTKALLGQIGLGSALLLGLFALFCFAVSHFFWRFGLKYYSSASS